MRVFVKNQRNEPLMPCSNKKARQLLKDKKAEIILYNPFTIRLLYATGETNQEINIGVELDKFNANSVNKFTLIR